MCRMGLGKVHVPNGRSWVGSKILPQWGNIGSGSGAELARDLLMNRKSKDRRTTLHLHMHTRMHAHLVLYLYFLCIAASHWPHISSQLNPCLHSVGIQNYLSKYSFLALFFFALIWYIFHPWHGTYRLRKKETKLLRCLRNFLIQDFCDF